jgi:hypothetical protein
MKKSILSLLALCFVLTMVSVTAFAEDTEKTLTRTEDWQLTSPLDLEVPEGTQLIIDGDSRLHIYEMGGELVNNGSGTVYLQSTLRESGGRSLLPRRHHQRQGRQQI